MMDKFKAIPKLDEDYDFKGDYKQNLDNLCETTQNVFNEIIEDKKFDLLYAMAGCESPIEQIMALRLFEYQNSRSAAIDYYRLDIETVDIESQYVINVDKKRYRVDFLIPVWDNRLKKGFSFAIECDGHDFHERTKEQAQHDKQRDRDILASGTYVMRYTGSEIYNNINIADEIFKNIKSIIFNQRKQRK